MINIAVNKENKELNRLNEKIKELTIEENKSLEYMNNMVGEYKNIKNSFAEENTKLQTVPKIEMPKVDTQQESQIKSINEEIEREMMNS